MTDGSFIPIAKAGQKVVVDLASRRPVAQKAHAAEIAKMGADLADMLAAKAGLSAAEIRNYHAQQEKQAIVTAFTRLARYTSPNEAVDFVEAMLAMAPGGP